LFLAGGLPIFRKREILETGKIAELEKRNRDLGWCSLRSAAAIYQPFLDAK
jgi:hypothetical protein